MIAIHGAGAGVTAVVVAEGTVAVVGAAVAATQVAAGTIERAQTRERIADRESDPAERAVGRPDPTQLRAGRIDKQACWRPMSASDRTSRHPSATREESQETDHGDLTWPPRTTARHLSVSDIHVLSRLLSLRRWRDPVAGRGFDDVTGVCSADGNCGPYLLETRLVT